MFLSLQVEVKMIFRVYKSFLHNCPWANTSTDLKNNWSTIVKVTTKLVLQAAMQDRNIRSS
ncbi:hypothetical protein Hanom_Chr04g00364121 [Helianthus anomalus]